MESNVLVKAFHLLESLAETADGRGLAELAGRVGLPKPTAHRLLATLSGLGYARRSGPGRYRLGEKVFELACGGGAGRLAEAGGPVARKLHARTGETVNLGVLRGERVVYLLVLESRHPLRRVVAPQESDPFHCTALGRALAAHLEPERLERLLAEAKFERRTPFTLLDRARLRRILRRVRQRGYAVERDETDVGVLCVGAPILAAGRAVAALSVSAPSARIDGKRMRVLVRAVRTAALELGAALGERSRWGHGAEEKIHAWA